jgi:hypothetical protein
MEIHIYNHANMVYLDRDNRLPRQWLVWVLLYSIISCSCTRIETVHTKLLPPSPAAVVTIFYHLRVNVFDVLCIHDSTMCIVWQDELDVFQVFVLSYLICMHICNADM